MVRVVIEVHGIAQRFGPAVAQWSVVIIIIIIKNECHSNIIVDRLQGCRLYALVA